MSGFLPEWIQLRRGTASGAKGGQDPCYIKPKGMNFRVTMISLHLKRPHWTACLRHALPTRTGKLLHDKTLILIFGLHFGVYHCKENS